MYSVEKRLSQLYDTLESVQRYAPDHDIVLVEGTLLDRLDPTIRQDLENKFPHVVFPNDPRVDNHYKCQGELSLLCHGIEFLLSNPLDSATKGVVKLSGRYRLNEPLALDEPYDTFRRIEEGSVFDEKRPCLYTFLYKIFNLDKFRRVCEQGLAESITSSVEHFFYNHYANDCQLVDHLGVEGNIAVNGILVQK
jgi:hypothetical protein